MSTVVSAPRSNLRAQKGTKGGASKLMTGSRGIEAELTGDKEGGGAASKGGASGGGKGGKEGTSPPERFCVDPQHLALFATREGEPGGGGGASGGGADEGERGLALRFIKLVSTTWTEEQVREELNSMRGRDEEAEMQEEADHARSQQLSLQPLYAKPPPVWLHPAFAAEFGDAFIAGTGLESGSLHVSLEVVVLTLQRMLSAGGTAAALPHQQRSALNSACALLDDAKKLAHKLGHAMAHPGQQRMYLSACSRRSTALSRRRAARAAVRSSGSARSSLSSGATQRQRTTSVRSPWSTATPRYSATTGRRPSPQGQDLRRASTLRDIGLDRQTVRRGLLGGALVCGDVGRRQRQGVAAQDALRASALVSPRTLSSRRWCDRMRSAPTTRSPSRPRCARLADRAPPTMAACATRCAFCCVATASTRRVPPRVLPAAAAAARDGAARPRLRADGLAAERSMLHVACRQLAYKAAKLGSPNRRSAAAKTPTPQRGLFRRRTTGGAAGAAAPPAGSSPPSAWVAPAPAAQTPPRALPSLASSDADADPASAARALLPGSSRSLSPSSTCARRKAEDDAAGRADPASATSPPPLILSEADVHLGRPSLETAAWRGERRLAPHAAALLPGNADEV